MQTLERAPKHPQPECSAPRQQRRKAARRFRVERRYIGPRMAGVIGQMFEQDRDWNVCGDYATERARRDALNRLVSKGDWLQGKYEYRLAH